MNMRAGSTIAMYWSPAIMLNPIEVSMTVAIVAPADVTRLITGAINLALNPAKSITAPNDMAPRINQTVSNMLLMPPPVKSASICATPVEDLKPLAIASQTPLSRASGVLNPGSAANFTTTCGCIITATSAPTSAPIRMERNAGYLRNPSSSNTAIGSRFLSEMLYADSRVASAWLVSTSGAVIS